MHSGGQWEHRGKKDQKLHPFPKGESALLTGSGSSLHLEGTCLLPAWIPGGITNTHQRGQGTGRGRLWAAQPWTPRGR